MPLPPRCLNPSSTVSGASLRTVTSSRGSVVLGAVRLIGQQATVRTAGDIVQIFHHVPSWRPMCGICRSLDELRALPAAQDRPHPAQRDVVS